jgi:Outer membrane receptor for ferrienterochelin and colicins
MKKRDCSRYIILVSLLLLLQAGVFSGRAQTQANPPDTLQIKTIEEVVVTGQFSPQSLRNSVYKVRVVNNLQIEQKAAASIQSLLNTEIGIRISNDMMLGETDFELMGMSGNNVKVLIDGVPVVDRGSNKQSLSQIDINTIARVEIVEGPMSVVYGTDALAGVINIITKKASIDSLKNRWYVSGGFQEETVGSEYAFLKGKGIHRENIQLGWTGRSGLYLNGGITRNTSGGWKSDKIGRELMWQPKDQYMYNGTVGYKKNGLNVWYKLNYLDEEIMNPRNGNDIHPEEVSDMNFNTDRFNHQLQSDWKINDKLDLNLAASYQDYNRSTQTIVTNTNTGEQWLSIEESAQDTSMIRTAFLRTTATWKVNNKLTLQPGLEYQWNKGSGERINGEPSITDIAAYISAEWSALKWLSVRPGLRSIVNSDYNAPAAIPTLMFKFSTGENVDIRLSYASGFRSPTLRELYFSFHNANHNIDGNPDLKAENSQNISAAVTWYVLKKDDLRLTSVFSGFYNDFRDRIVLTPDANDPTHNIYDNMERYKTTGGTIENNLSWKNLYANVGVSLVGRYNRYSEREDGGNLPKFRYSPEVSASISYKIAKSGTNLNLFYKFTGARQEYVFDSNSSIFYLRGLKGHKWADFTVTQKLSKIVSLNAGIKNIFDVTMVSTTTGDGQPVGGTGSLIGCGRSFFFGLNFNLEL